MKLGKKKEKDTKKNDDFLAQEAAEDQATANEYTLDIPEDEIWTYQIEGLQAPHIGKPFKNAGIKKVVVVIALVISIGLAIFFSLGLLSSEPYTYKELDDGTYELVRFSNPAEVTDVTVDYCVTGFEKDDDGNDDYSKPIKDETKVITSVAEYAFNGDDKLNSITLGKDVKTIDGKSIYSCWWVRNVFVDDENPYLCDIDGVLYNKDITTLIHYPNNHNKQLRIENDYAYVDQDGVVHSKLYADYDPKKPDAPKEEIEELWGTTNNYNEAYYQKYNRETRTYVVPSTVTTLGELSLAYSHLVDIYLPEGLTKMDNMALFKNDNLVNIYSYTTDEVITDTTYKSIDKMKTVYASLPEGLQFIGSDCMYFARSLNYMYIPASVNHIGHHALWDAALKEGDNITGVYEINTIMNEKQFEDNVDAGQQWKPQYDYMLFKKSVDVIYSSQRQSQKLFNVHRQYYWAIQWVVNHYDNDAKENCGYIIKDLNHDTTPELILREYDTETGKPKDSVLTFKYGYIDKYSGSVKYSADEFSRIDDNTMLDSILESK